MEPTKGQIRYRRYRKSYITYAAAYRKKNREALLLKNRLYKATHARKSMSGIFNEGMVRFRDKHMYSGKRKIVLERDNYKCVECGITQEDHVKKYKRDITIHHRDGNGYYSTYKNNALENLETLCLSCHKRKDVMRVKYGVEGADKLMRELVKKV